MNALTIPDLCLVALVGISGSGKTTLARRCFGRYEVVSSDICRGLVSDDENDQDATRDAFDLLGYLVGKRLARGRLTVVDATNVSRDARRQLIDLARAHDVLPVAIVLDVPLSVAIERNAARPDRDFGARVVRRHHESLRRSLRGLQREGFRVVHVLRGVEGIDAATIVREPLRSDLRDDHGPFDVIGDVHGCLAELLELLDRLGYQVELDAEGRPVGAAHPDGRRVIYVGDLVDRGPDSVGVLRLAMGMHAAGHALAVPGNHEHKLVRALDGRDVTTGHGLAQTLAQLAAEAPDFRAAVREWCDGLVAHLVLDDGRLVVAHAGLPEKYHGRASGRVRSFALFGDVTGRLDEHGLPERLPWADDYRGSAMVLYGHVPTPQARWVNNTMCLDTGCAYGGRLSALRYPEKELVQVPARERWSQPARPFPPRAELAGPDATPSEARPSNAAAPKASAVDASKSVPPTTAPLLTAGVAGTDTAGGAAPRQISPDPAQPAAADADLPGDPRAWLASAQTAGLGTEVAGRSGDAGGGLPGSPDDLSLDDVLGRRVVQTRALGRVTVRPEQAAGALEVMSRFAMHPRWLGYLPPTMSPVPTSCLDGVLEHPTQAFADYAGVGVRQVICQEKHMGSRAIVLVCRDAQVARECFGAADPFEVASGPAVEEGELREAAGAIYTRTGRAALSPAAMRALLARLRAALNRTGLWEELATDWLLLDAELLPWSLKADGLLQERYVAVAAAASAALPAVTAALAQGAARGLPVGDLAQRTQERAEDIAAFASAYHRYRWPAQDDESLAGVRLAPFQILAGRGHTWTERDHVWHLGCIDRLVEADPELLTRTARLVVDTSDDAAQAEGVAWWQALLDDGGEGMVVKPMTPPGGSGSTARVQPGLKVRGPEYLRLVYGPEYARPAHLARLRERHLQRKRSLALREYALGLEALERLAAGEPLWRVHECVFAVLALESDPVDPRL